MESDSNDDEVMDYVLAEIESEYRRVLSLEDEYGGGGGWVGGFSFASFPSFPL